jgi:hypothetical protein
LHRNVARRLDHQDTRLGHDERRSVLHQTRNEMHVVRQAIKLCDDAGQPLSIRRAALSAAVR